MHEIIWKDVGSAVNYIEIPITKIDPCENIEEANQLLKYIQNNYKEGKFIKTKSGGISKNAKNMKSMFEMSRHNQMYEIILHDNKKGWARIQFRNIAKNDHEIYGTAALKELLKRAPKLKDYVCYDEKVNEYWHNQAKRFYNISLFGEQAFFGIPEEAEQFNGYELDHVWSLDIHSAFPAALAEVVPEIYQSIQTLYEKRKKDPKAKAIMNLAIGTMTSKVTKMCGLKVERALSKVRFDTLQRHLQYVVHLKNKIIEQGGIPLNLRTDSIKFYWDKPYAPQLPGQGNNLGEWDYEFKDCKYRQISTGKYEYIDNSGKYHAVVNGKTKLDRIKPRDQWEWGDIMNKDTIELGWSYNALKNEFELKEGVNYEN